MRVRTYGLTLLMVAALSACGGGATTDTTDAAAPLPATGQTGAQPNAPDVAAATGDQAGSSDGAGGASTGSGGTSTGSGGTSTGSNGSSGGSSRSSGPVSARRAVDVQGTLVVHAAPSSQSKVMARLPGTTALGSPRVLLVRQVKSGWVQVTLPTRPNGSAGWVASSAVRVETTHDRITVDLAARRITVFLNGSQVARSTVAIGSTANPTPTGTFYVTDRVRPSNPKGAYGAFALGLSAHSTTLSEFGNGDGQVGIHGTDVPGSIGKAVSHGCVRVPDKVTTVLARIPLGTPVIIT